MVPNLTWFGRGRSGSLSGGLSLAEYEDWGSFFLVFFFLGKGTFTRTKSCVHESFEEFSNHQRGEKMSLVVPYFVESSRED